MNDTRLKKGIIYSPSFIVAENFVLVSLNYVLIFNRVARIIHRRITLSKLHETEKYDLCSANLIPFSKD